jgi:hypothetical protein
MAGGRNKYQSFVTSYVVAGTAAQAVWNRILKLCHPDHS